MIRYEIEKQLKEIAGDARFTLERPGNPAHGDYATNVALVSKQDPQEIASKLSIPGVEKVEVVGKFINFFLSQDSLLDEIAKREIPQLFARKKIVVEYTQPNPFKEFHIGHLMSNALGESVARLLHHTGAQVIRANYQGDVGPHVAKAIWGKMQKPELRWGESYVYGNTEYEAHKTEIDEINKKVYEKSDPQINALYEQGRKESLDHFEEIYKILGTKFDHYFFESETGPVGLQLIQQHKDIFEESDGALVYRGAHTRVFVTGQGLPTYEAKELGLAKLKIEKAPADWYITITANEQNGFFEVVCEALKKIFPSMQLTHHSHGLMRFAEGKMSSRKGNVITGETLLYELKEKARGRMDVAVGALKYAILKQGSNKDIIFDPDRSLSLEGDSGPYLQYALVRARSVLEKVVKEEERTPKEDHWIKLARALVHYPEMVARAAKDLEPHYLTTYLTELSGVFSAWYGAEQFVIEGTIASVHKNILEAFALTMTEGLHLLGIPAPEEM